MASKILWNNMKIVKGKLLVETVATGVANYPASGSYIDVSGYEYFHILMHLGTINAGDSPTMTPQCSDTASGTLHDIDSTLAHTPAVDDDGEWVVWTIATENLPLADHHFVTLTLSGTYSNTSYWDVLFLLDGPRELPVSQTTAVLPAASRYSFVG